MEAGLGNGNMPGTADDFGGLLALQITMLVADTVLKGTADVMVICCAWQMIMVVRCWALQMIMVVVFCA